MHNGLPVVFSLRVKNYNTYSVYTIEYGPEQTRQLLLQVCDTTKTRAYFDGGFFFRQKHGEAAKIVLG